MSGSPFILIVAIFIIGLKLLPEIHVDKDNNELL
jgi:hypothetical protein